MNQVYAEDALDKVNRCFLQFGADFDENIKKIINTAGVIFNGACCLYNKEEDELLCTRGGWNIPEDLNRQDRKYGHICFDVIKKKSDEPFVIRNLETTSYAQSDPNVSAYNLKTYIGCAVKTGGETVGSLCVVYDADRCFTDHELYIISILARAIGIEEEHRKAEEVLKESEKKYHSLITNIPDILWTTSNTGNTVFISSNIEKIYGYTAEEIYAGGEHLWIGRIHPDDIEKVMEGYKMLFEKGIPFEVEYRVKRKDGELIWLYDRSISTYEKDGGMYADGIFSLINERKKAEQKLRKKTHELAERVKELNCHYNFSKITSQPDISLEKIFQDLVNIIPTGWQYPEITCARIVFEDTEYATANFKMTEWKQSADIMIHGSKAGTVEVYYSKEKPGIDEGPFLKEERNLINDLAERLEKIIERKKAEEEKERLQRQLIQSEKMTSLGEIAAGIAHELNTPLNVILGYQELIKRKIDADSPCQEYVNIAIEEVEQCRQLIQDFMTYARPASNEDLLTQSFNLPEALESSIKLLALHKTKNIKIHLNIEENIPHVQGDQKQIMQVFVNIINNAIQAMPEGGEISISVKHMKNGDLLHNEEKVEFRIYDTGGGIKEEDMHKIFDPFFTTKRSGGGTGLGLAICQRIMDNHKGTMRIESETGKGTTVIGELPALRQLRKG